MATHVHDFRMVGGMCSFPGCRVLFRPPPESEDDGPRYTENEWRSLRTERDGYRTALEQIEAHFLPGKHKSTTYSSDARGMLIEIRDTARAALNIL